MVNVLFGAGLFERWGAEYLETHCDGSKARKAWKAAGAWLAFMRRLATGSVALLHVHIASDASFWRKACFIVPARALGVPYVLHMHGGDFGRFYAERCGPLAKRFLRRVYREAEVVIALTGEWREAIRAVVPEARVVVVPNPVEIPRAPAAPDAAAPRVTYLGVVKEAKGVYELLRAWPAIVAAHPKARLTLAGSGEIERARALAEALGVAASVELPGWTGGEAKARLLAGTTVFVLPSHFEALPMSLLEAMAAGLPVVATRVGGIPDALEDGRDGVLVAPKDEAALAREIDALLADPGRRALLALAARRRAAEEFSVAAVVPRIEAIWARHAPSAERTSGASRACP